MKPTPVELNGEPQRAGRRIIQWVMLPLFLAAAWSGCKQEAQVAGDTDPAGTYTLVSVDGNKVPCTVQHDGHSVAVKSGTFIINADGTCTSKLLLSPPSGGDAAREVKATYARQGSKLTFRWEGAGLTTGTVDHGTFTMDNEGMILAYRKSE